MKKRTFIGIITTASVFALFFIGSSVFAPRDLHKLRPPDWRELTDSAPFGVRDTSQPFLFDNRMWLSNGYRSNNTAYRDLWSTKDGLNWQEEVAATPYDKYSGIAVLNGNIYAAKNTVWRSSNGKDWHQLTAVGPTSDKDALPMMRAFDGRLWFFDKNSVHSSADGATWQTHRTPPFSNRSSYAVEVFNGSLWVIGGGVLGEKSDPQGIRYPDRRAVNDVWRSSDGNTWEKVTDAPFEPRMWPSTAVHRDELYLVGGYSNVKSKNFNDVWKTSDGRTWEKVETETKFSPRHWVSLWSNDGSLFLAAGNARPLVNDVWVYR